MGKSPEKNHWSLDKINLPTNQFSHQWNVNKANNVPFLMVAFASSSELSSSELDSAFLMRVFFAPIKHWSKSHNITYNSCIVRNLRTLQNDKKKKNLPMTFTLKNVVKFGDKVKSEIMMNYFWEMLNWWKWIEPYF